MPEGTPCQISEGDSFSPSQVLAAERVAAAPGADCRSGLARAMSAIVACSFSAAVGAGSGSPLGSLILGPCFSLGPWELEGFEGSGDWPDGLEACEPCPEAEEELGAASPLPARASALVLGALLVLEEESEPPPPQPASARAAAAASARINLALAVLAFATRKP